MSLPSFFEFTSFSFTKSTGELLLNYRLGDQYSFQERLLFPPDQIRADLDEELLDAALFQLHLAGGMSYWKMYCLKDIRICSGEINEAQAQFWNTLYTKGLGEFYFKNQIDFRDLVRFPYVPGYIPISRSYTPIRGTLVPIGGGKDSIVTAELLMQAGFSITPVSLYRHEPVIETIRVMGKEKESLVIERFLDSQLRTLNQLGVYNGHVPITGYINFVFLVAAVLYGYEYTAWSLEKSANIGQITYLDMEINHQYSKSEEFESDLQQYIHSYVTPSYTPFSFLRSLHELAIAQEFASCTRRAAEEGRDYLSILTSCNNAYKLIEEKKPGRWCGTCPKCAFVYAIFAPFLKPEELHRLVGHSIFENPEMYSMYRDLLGIGTMKPFECVGTFEETTCAFLLLQEKRMYMDTPVMEMFLREVRPHISNPEQLCREVMERVPSPHTPALFETVISSSVVTS